MCNSIVLLNRFRKSHEFYYGSIMNEGHRLSKIMIQCDLR